MLASVERCDALLAVKFLKDAEIPILSEGMFGTVARVTSSQHTRIGTLIRNPDENQYSYSNRSCEAAEQYLRNFPEQADVEQLFVLVIRQ